MKNTNKIGFTMPHMEESDGLSPLSAAVAGEMKGISPSEYLSRRAIEKEKDIYLKKSDGEDEFNREISEKYVTGYPDYEIKNPAQRPQVNCRFQHGSLKTSEYQ